MNSERAKPNQFPPRPMWVIGNTRKGISINCSGAPSQKHTYSSPSGGRIMPLPSIICWRMNVRSLHNRCSTNLPLVNMTRNLSATRKTLRPIPRTTQVKRQQIESKNAHNTLWSLTKILESYKKQVISSMVSLNILSITDTAFGFIFPNLLLILQLFLNFPFSRGERESRITAYRHQSSYL